MADHGPHSYACATARDAECFCDCHGAQHGIRHTPTPHGKHSTGVRITKRGNHYEVVVKSTGKAPGGGRPARAALPNTKRVGGPQVSASRDAGGVKETRAGDGVVSRAKTKYKVGASDVSQKLTKLNEAPVDERPQARDEVRAAALAAYREVTSGTYAGLTVHWQDNEVTVGDSGRVEVEGIIRNADGKTVGRVARRLQHGLDGSLYAKHEWLQLNNDVQGTGFAREFNAALEDWYRETGVKSIKILANIDVGGYAWARQGYDFEKDASRTNYIDRIRREVNRERDLGPVGRPGSIPSERQKQLDAGKAFIDKVDAGYVPTAYEISQVGWEPGMSGKDAMWLGKETLLGTSWSGVKWLD